MASLQKHRASAVAAVLAHNERRIASPSNKDIDPSRSHLNYSLLERDVPAYQYYRETLQTLHYMKRADVIHLCSWVITAPADLPENQSLDFFSGVLDFIINRYPAGERAIVQAVVHADEAGDRPHVHILSLPIVEDKKRGGEKLCADALFSRKELLTFHPDLQRFLYERGINATVKSGITKAQGGNRTIAELKHERDIIHEETPVSRWDRNRHDIEYERGGRW